MPAATQGINWSACSAEGIYVLHCFQKKTRKTTRQDAQLARNRFKAIANSPERR